MAKDKTVWERIKADYEIAKYPEYGIFARLSREYDVDRTVISRRAKKEGWEYGKNARLAKDEVSIITDYAIIQDKKARLNKFEQQTVKKEVDLELAKRNITANNIAIIEQMQEEYPRMLETLQYDYMKPQDFVKMLKTVEETIDPSRGKVDVSINQNTITLKEAKEKLNDEDAKSLYLELLRM